MLVVLLDLYLQPANSLGAETIWLIIGVLLTYTAKEALKGLFILKCIPSTLITGRHPSADMLSPCPSLWLHKSPTSVCGLTPQFCRCWGGSHSFLIPGAYLSQLLSFTAEQSFSSQQEVTLCAQPKVTNIIMKNHEVSVSLSFWMWLFVTRVNRRTGIISVRRVSLANEVISWVCVLISMD